MTIDLDDLGKALADKKALAGVKTLTVAEPAWLKTLVGAELPRYLQVQKDIQAIVDSPVARAMRDHDAMVRRLAEDLVGPTSAIHQTMRQFETGSAFMTGIAKIHEHYTRSLPAIDAMLGVFADKLGPWLETERKLSAAIEASGILGFKDTLADIDRFAAATRAELHMLDGFVLGNSLPGIPTARIERPVRRLTRSYDRLVTSIADNPVRPALVPLVLGLPTRSVSAHIRAVSAITRREGEEPVIELWAEAEEQALAVIHDVLPRIKPALLVSWRGVREALRRRQADWLRQASASLRYLLTDTLDLMAPKATVLAAGVDPKLLMQDGSPSRRAQVRWLCRGIESETYGNMVSADLESALTIVTMVNEAVHDEGYAELEEAFARVTVRADIALQHLLEIFRTRQ